MNWMRWVVFVRVRLNAAWMAFDGTRALISGDYVTAASGKNAGQLGPWSGLVTAVGLQPRSTLVKALIAIFGVAMLLMATCFALRLAWARTGLLVLAILGLWYLPFGTITGAIVILFLLVK